MFCCLMATLLLSLLLDVDVLLFDADVGVVLLSLLLFDADVGVVVVVGCRCFVV